jgi:small basic protein (TIGR04137 family)
LLGRDPIFRAESIPQRALQEEPIDVAESKQREGDDDYGRKAERELHMRDAAGTLLRNDVRHLKNTSSRLMCRLLFAPNPEQSMSQHRSLKGASTIAAKRNVLKRFERVELLKKRGQWKETSKVVGLPKTKPDA